MTRAALWLWLFAVPALAAPVTYNLDPAKTELLAFTEPTGIFKGASHSHVIQAQNVVGKVVFDADAVESSRVMVSFPVSAMTVDEPALRKREGLTTLLNERDRQDITRSMRSTRQLDDNRFPQISFDSTKVTRKGDDKLEVTGRMSLHGVRKSITLPVSYSVTDGVFRGEGTYTFNHSDFGLVTFTAVMGTVRNAEPIRLKILLVGTAREAPDFTLDGLAPAAAPADAGQAAPEAGKQTPDAGTPKR